MNDHELLIGSTTRALELVRDDSGRALYQVVEDIPLYKQALTFGQSNWLGGHGRYDFNENEPDLYLEGQSIDTTQPGKVILGPLIYEVKEADDTDLDSAPVCFVWFNASSEWLCATSGKIYRYNVGGSGKWTAATTIVAGVLGLCEHNGVMYASVGAATKYYYSTDGITWTQTDLTDGYSCQMLSAPNADGTANVLWKFKTPNEISSTTDGKTVAAGGVQWSSPAYIGDTSNNITSIFLINDKLMIGRTDELYWYDSNGGVHPQMGDLTHNKSANNFKYIVQWQASTYFSLVDGLGEITSYDAFDPMGPLTKIDDIGKKGSAVGLASDKDWLYVVMDEGTDSHIYKGREIGSRGGLRWEWCPFVFLSTAACATARVCAHSVTDRRLWFGYGNNTGYIKLSDNPLADSSYRFAPSGWLRMSYYLGTEQYWDKLWQSVVTETAGCSATIKITPKYRKDTDASSTALSAAITTNGTVKTNLTTALSCNKISFEVYLETNNGTTSPQLLFFQARGIEKPEKIRIHEATYKAVSKPSITTTTVRNFLRDGRNSTSLIKFADLRYGQSTAGTDYQWVIIEPGYPKEVEITHEKGRQPELGIQVRMREVSYTIS